MEDSSDDQSSSMSISSISAGSSYYYYSGVDDTYEYDEDSEIEKENSQDRKTISGRKTDKKYESTLNTADTREADLSAAKQQRRHKKKKIQEKKTDLENKYKCRRCARSYKHKSNLCEHQKLECGVAPQFNCSLCDKRFKEKTKMNRHIVCVHQLSISTQIKSQLSRHISSRHLKNSKISEARYNCDKCNLSYNALRNLRRHKLIKHAAVKPQFICDDCGHKTDRKSLLSRHISSRHFKNSETSRARYNCDKCNLTYSSLDALRQHKRIKHAAVKPQFICDDCGHKTDRKSHLSRHISSRHFKNSGTSRARYNCDKCNLGYKSLHNLRRHERIKHAAVKPQFLCDDCGYKTDVKSNLSNHISSRHFK